MNKTNKVLGLRVSYKKSEYSQITRIIRYVIVISRNSDELNYYVSTNLLSHFKSKQEKG